VSTERHTLPDVVYIGAVGHVLIIVLREDSPGEVPVSYAESSPFGRLQPGRYLVRRFMTEGLVVYLGESALEIRPNAQAAAN
jgi:hypothetical protein